MSDNKPTSLEGGRKEKSKEESTYENANAYLVYNGTCDTLLLRLYLGITQPNNAGPRIVGIWFTACCHNTNVNRYGKRADDI